MSEGLQVAEEAGLNHWVALFGANLAVFVLGCSLHNYMPIFIMLRIVKHLSRFELQFISSVAAATSCLIVSYWGQQSAASACQCQQSEGRQIARQSGAKNRTRESGV